MVSDPKCYNPKIVHHLTMSGFRKMNEDVARDFSLRLFIYIKEVIITNGWKKLNYYNSFHTYCCIKIKLILQHCLQASNWQIKNTSNWFEVLQTW